MIIKALTIENFKGIREPVRVEFKKARLDGELWGRLVESNLYN